MVGRRLVTPVARVRFSYRPPNSPVAQRQSALLLGAGSGYRNSPGEQTHGYSVTGSTPISKIGSRESYSLTRAIRTRSKIWFCSGLLIRKKAGSIPAGSTEYGEHSATGQACGLVMAEVRVRIPVFTQNALWCSGSTTIDFK